MENCCCGSGKMQANCCLRFHKREDFPQSAEELMRSRYSAYVTQRIDYIIETTVPAQRNLLNREDLEVWSRETEWLGLTVKQHIPLIDKRYAIVDFTAYFDSGNGRKEHNEQSVFVQIANRWYFIDPTVPLPSMKQPCLCGSEKKFKACCGRFFK